MAASMAVTPASPANLPPPRRDVPVNALRKEKQADAVGVLHCRKGEDRRKLRGDVTLAPVDRSECHRARHVDDHEHRQVALLDELLHMRDTAARRDIQSIVRTSRPVTPAPARTRSPSMKR
jgi:hypothetical protein